jgi:putative toxin-antitoxin system antitoxin component (TIGR02293 family)
MSESDRLDSDAETRGRIDRVRHRAEQVFGDAAKAKRWLGKPSRGLGGRTPLQLAETGEGAAAVEAELVRIEHGVYA